MAPGPALAPLRVCTDGAVAALGRRRELGSLRLPPVLKPPGPLRLGGRVCLAEPVALGPALVLAARATAPRAVVVVPALPPTADLVADAEACAEDL